MVDFISTKLKKRKGSKTSDSEAPLYHLPKKKRSFLIWIIHHQNQLIRLHLLLAFPSPPPASSRAILSKVSIIRNQGDVVRLIAIILSRGNTNTRTSFQWSKESCDKAIDEPSCHPIKLPTCWRAMGWWRSSYSWLHRIWSDWEEATAGGSNGSHEKWKFEALSVPESETKTETELWKLQPIAVYKF